MKAISQKIITGSALPGRIMSKTWDLNGGRDSIMN
jgi:hypothetical protein